MKSTYIFPLILILLDICAAAVNFYNKEYKVVMALLFYGRDD